MKGKDTIVINGKEYPIAPSGTLYYKVGNVMQLLNVSDSKAYKIMQTLNSELNKKGYLTIAGQVSKKYFKERYYG